jgi:hypothetical protein
MATFINTAIIPLFTNFNQDQWFTSTGLVNDAWFNVLAISFGSPFARLLDPIHFLNVVKRKYQIWRGIKSKIN